METPKKKNGKQRTSAIFSIIKEKPPNNKENELLERIPQKAWDELFSHECDCNCSPGNREYDYIIDLKQEEIFVYRDDGREFVVPHDSLDEFIINDNI